MTVSVNNSFSPKNVALKRKAPSFSALNINSSKVSKTLNWMQENLASHHQRLILGVTALSLQPFIDLSNKKVDEQTRKVSCAKTVAKAIVGTTSGFFVRWACTTLAKNYTSVTENGVKAAKKSFLAPSVMANYSRDRRIQYINTIGAILGVMTCFFTNFLWDAPGTKYLTNRIIDMFGLKHKTKGGVK